MAGRLLHVGGIGLLLATSAACAGAAEPEDVGTTESAWEAHSVHNEGASTHLWLVERALDILAKHPGHARAAAAHALLEDPTCKPHWRQGLFDADYRHEFNDGDSDLTPGASLAAIAWSGATWKSHFYDPDTQRNWKGETSPTALTQALAHHATARSLVARDKPRACYALGLSLHYLTDLTQPMHAAGFTAVSRPRGLHSNLEHWSMDIQSGFVRQDWSAEPRGDLRSFIVAVARGSKHQWSAMWNAVADAYDASPNPIRCGSLRDDSILVAQQIDRPSCWQGAGVRAQVGASLGRAQDLTAQYLALVGGLD